MVIACIINPVTRYYMFDILGDIVVIIFSLFQVIGEVIMIIAPYVFKYWLDIVLLISLLFAIFSL